MRHARSQRKPREPTIRKAGRLSPSRPRRSTTSTGATAAPTDEPLSKSATAKPRSRRGNHSETALVAAGQFAASPAPSRKRKVAKLRKPPASDVSIATTEYQSTARERPLRVPNRSSRRPDTACMTAYARRKEITIQAKVALDQPNSVL